MPLPPEGRIVRPLITPVMIARDEQRFLPGALQSLSLLGPMAAPACLYDTGSVDATMDIARSAGATVRVGYWDDDFARARNEAVAMSGTSWVLSLDADERVVVRPALLHAALLAAERQDLDALVFELDDVRDGQVVNTAPMIRIFRPARACFRNRIHEIVVPRDGGTLRVRAIPREALHVRHVGYEPGEAMTRRHRRNTRIGDLEVEAARGQGADARLLVEALVNRGRSRSLGGDWAAGIPDWLEARSYAADTTFRLYAAELLARAHIEIGRPSEAVPFLQAMQREGSDANLVAWLTAQAFTAAGRAQQALDALQGVSAPVSALGERHGLAPLLQARMLAAAEVGETARAIDDAVELMAGHGVKGFARLLTLMWGDRPAEELTARLRAADRGHLDQVVTEFERLAGEGDKRADAVWRCATGEQAL